MKTLIEQLDKSIHERIIEEWYENHYGKMSLDEVELEMERAYKKIVKHLVDIGFVEEK
jgi:hypothetical protein